MSKAIIRPRTAPSRIASPELSLMLSRPLVRPVMRRPSGRPSSTTMTKPLMSVASSGITSTGISPRAHDGTFQFAIQWAVRPARTPPMTSARRVSPDLMVSGSGVSVDEAA